MILVTKTEHEPNIKYALINNMRLLSRVYGIVEHVMLILKDYLSKDFG